jgi:hypothetical protein
VETQTPITPTLKKHLEEKGIGIENSFHSVGWRRTLTRQRCSPASKGPPKRADAGPWPQRVATPSLPWNALHFCCPAGKLKVNR